MGARTGGHETRATRRAAGELLPAGPQTCGPERRPRRRGAEVDGPLLGAAQGMASRQGGLGIKTCLPARGFASRRAGRQVNDETAMTKGTAKQPRRDPFPARSAASRPCSGRPEQGRRAELGTRSEKTKAKHGETLFQRGVQDEERAGRGNVVGPAAQATAPAPARFFPPLSSFSSVPQSAPGLP